MDPKWVDKFEAFVKLYKKCTLASSKKHTRDLQVRFHFSKIYQSWYSIAFNMESVFVKLGFWKMQIQGE